VIATGIGWLAFDGRARAIVRINTSRRGVATLRRTRPFALRRQKKLIVGASLLALAAITAQASAHVTVGTPTLEVIDFNFRAPVEPAPTTPEELAAHHTDKLSLTFPAGFKVDRCDETADFACTATVDRVEWTRRDGSANFQAVDFFRVSVRTPGIGGTYRVPAIQTYSDGEEVRWVDPNPDDPRPAPQLRVNGPDRAPDAASGAFKPLGELGAGNPCPQEVIDDAIAQGIDPAVHCGHFGFEPPAGSPTPPGEQPPGGEPPGEEEPKLDVRGTAGIVRTADRTYVQVHVTGLEPGLVYTAHLHEGTCGNPTSAHYRNDPAGAEETPNELWPSSSLDDPTAGLTADENGEAFGMGIAEWVARPTARAIWIHEPPVDPNDQHAHARIGCADLV
jgi:hypothetical protein